MNKSMDGNMNGGKCVCEGGCGCCHHKVMPVLVTLFGVVFLLGAFEVLAADVVGIIWPIIVIVGGLSKLFGGSCKCC